MKKLALLTALLISGLATAVAQVVEEHLDIDTSKSEILWYGDYAFYFGGHEGTITFKEGYFIKKDDGSISGGTFIIDMDTIKSTDIDNEEARASLDDHLKNEDFFDVPKYPTATLVIRGLEYHDATHLKIYADLTIKDITNPINFQAEIDYAKAEMTTRFKIDRTLWGVTYNSKEVEGKLKDGLISDAIGFEVILRL